MFGFLERRRKRRSRKKWGNFRGVCAVTPCPKIAYLHNANDNSTDLGRQLKRTLGLKSFCNLPWWYLSRDGKRITGIAITCPATKRTTKTEEIVPHPASRWAYAIEDAIVNGVTRYEETLIVFRAFAGSLKWSSYAFCSSTRSTGAATSASGFVVSFGSSLVTRSSSRYCCPRLSCGRDKRRMTRVVYWKKNIWKN